MSLLNFFNRRKSSKVIISGSKELLKALERDETDYLGMAVEAGKRAKNSMKENKLDLAWESYQEQKELYLKHAKRSEFTPRQAIAIEGSVHEGLANICRLEGKHVSALIHLSYCIATTAPATKSLKSKLNAYVKRANLKTICIDDIRSLIKSHQNKPNFKLMSQTISSWDES